MLASFEKVTSVPATTLCSALQAVAFESIEISTAAVVAAASNLKTMGVQSGPLQAGDPLEPQQYVLPGLLQGEQRRLLQESTHREKSWCVLHLPATSGCSLTCPRSTPAVHAAPNLSCSSSCATLEAVPKCGSSEVQKKSTAHTVW